MIGGLFNAIIVMSTIALERVPCMVPGKDILAQKNPSAIDPDLSPVWPLLSLLPSLWQDKFSH